MIKTLFTSCLLLATLMLTACGGYRLQGKVVEGPISTVTTLDKSSEQFLRPGIPNVEIKIVIDPRSPSRTILPVFKSGADGKFSIPVEDLTGAGFLEYKIHVRSVQTGFVTTQGVTDIPNFENKLLIVMPAGRSHAQPDDPGAIETIKRYYPDKDKPIQAPGDNRW